MAASASLLIIGDEILAGRTQDKNIAYIGNYLQQLGIDLVEVRIVPDEEGAIVSAVNELRAKTTYLFTTGGIGPTHDDITADCVAKAFNVPIDHDPRAVAILKAHYKPEMLNEARLRMARIPEGAELIENLISKAPGFKLGNVIVMAGVPNIMQAMLDAVAPTLNAGTPPRVVTIDGRGVMEGAYAADLREIAETYPEVTIGSYPHFDGKKYATQLVLRSRHEQALEDAARMIEDMLEKMCQKG